MRKNKLLLVLFAAIIYLNAAAQYNTPKLCGNGKINMEEFSRLRNSSIEKAPGALPAFVSTNFIVRVFFHICRYDDGTSAAATYTNIQSEFATLLADYSAGNICFINEGLDYIDNTALDTINWDKTGGAVFLPYTIPDCINIFYTQKIGGTNTASGGGGYGGITYTIPGIFCLVSTGNIGAGHSISHETGHCLGLLHPFESYGQTRQYLEDIDGSNGGVSADYVADTKADPYAFIEIGSSCFATSSCIYSGSCTDPKNQTNYSPPYTNIMGYWWAGSCYNNNVMTTGQYNRVDTFLRGTQALINTRLYTTQDLTIGGAPTNNNLGPNFQISSGTNQYLAQNQIYISGANNIISGTANVQMISGGNIFLEPGIDVVPSSGGVALFTVTATCSSTPSPLITYSKKKSTGLTAYPNPASSSVNLVFDLADHAGNAIIEVYDMSGRKMKEISLENLIAGKHSVALDISRFTNGIYSVVLQLPYSMMRVTVIKAK